MAALNGSGLAATICGAFVAALRRPLLGLSWAFSRPRPDPIAAADSEKAQAYSIASTINAVYRAFLKGKDMAAVKGWDDVAQKLGAHAGPVIEFLKNFVGG